MITSDRWFKSGAFYLASHFDLPATENGRKGVLIVPPFGWEDVCSYQSLRFLGQNLAANGIPAMRFDLPGTGDSSGSALNSGLVDAWIKSTADATAELRKVTGVREVAIFGLRLGATLGLAAASAGADVQDLILWGPALNGRAILRELRAFQLMEQSNAEKGEVVDRQPIPGLEVAGFFITPETQRALEALDLSVLPCLTGKRTLMLTRDDLPVDEKLLHALKTSGCTVEVQTGRGYAAMLADPHDAVPPLATSKQIVDFLKTNLQAQRPHESSVPIPPALSQQAPEQSLAGTFDDGGGKVRETMFRLRRSEMSMFGILSEPGTEVPRSDLGLLFLNPGAARHIGPNRMWVAAARRWALRGIPSLRMDFAGIGEADGERAPDLSALYQGEVVEQVEMAMDELRIRSGTKRFVVIGLCSGAFWAFHSAIRHPAIREAILLNPRLFFWDPEVDRRRMTRQTMTSLTNVTAWSRLAQGKVKLHRLKQAAQAAVGSFQKPRADSDDRLQIPPRKMADALAQIVSNRNRLTLIFAEGEALLREMEEESQMPPQGSPCIRCIRVPGANHTFRPLWAQQAVHDLIDGVIEAALPDPLSGVAEQEDASDMRFPSRTLA